MIYILHVDSLKTLCSGRHFVDNCFSHRDGELEDLAAVLPFSCLCRWTMKKPKLLVCWS